MVLSRISPSGLRNDAGSNGAPRKSDLCSDPLRVFGGSQLPCDDDKTVLTILTQDKAMLQKIADGTGAGACPGGVALYACALVSWKYDSVKTTAGPMKRSSQYSIGPPSTWRAIPKSKCSRSRIQSTGRPFHRRNRLPLRRR